MRVLLIDTELHPVGRILAARPGIDLAVICLRGQESGYGADVVVEAVETVADLTAVRVAAMRIARVRPFTAVLAPTEWGVQAAGYLRSYFALDGMSYDCANTFSNKLAMKRVLRRAGVPVAASEGLGAIDQVVRAGERFGWPLIVKRVLGGGAEGMQRLESCAEAQAFVDSARARTLERSPYPLMIERWLDVDEEYHCDGVIVDGDVVFTSVGRYFAPVLQGLGGVLGSVTTPEDDPAAAIVRRLHRQTVEALGHTNGVTHLEALRVGDEWFVGEIACRSGGGAIPQQCRTRYGVDLHAAFVATALGLPFETPGPSRADYVLETILPLPQGRIVSMVDVEELRRLPGTVDANLAIAVGEEYGGPSRSTTCAGTVVSVAVDRADIDRQLARLSSAYRVETVPL